MRLVLFVLIGLALFLSFPWASGDSDPFAKRRALAMFAEQVNPIIRSLQPAAASLYARANDDVTVTTLCQGQDAQLEDLRVRRSVIEEAERHIPRALSRSSIIWQARDMLDSRSSRVKCSEKWIRGEGHRPCATWCLQSWNELADLIDDVRTEGERWGVHIESLRQ